MAEELRWHRSQREIETALARGPKAVRDLQAETGYSYNTVMACLRRAETIKSGGWPIRYTLVRSAFEEAPKAQLSDMQPIAPIVKIVHLVEPARFQMEDVGPKWQAGRTKISEEIEALDLESMSLKQAVQSFEIEIASLLGVLVQLKAVKDGPDWREQIGLTP